MDGGIERTDNIDKPEIVHDKRPIKINKVVYVKTRFHFRGGCGTLGDLVAFLCVKSIAMRTIECI